MYLTRITLDPRTKQSRNLLLNTQRLHAAVAASFNVQPDDTARVLWRLDMTASGHACLLVSSPRGPNINEVTTRVAPLEKVETRPYDDALASIRDGGIYSFRIAVNPIVHTRLDEPIRKPERSNGERGHLLTHRRTPILSQISQVEWLDQKLTSHGARLCTVDIDGTKIPDVIPVREDQDNFTRTGTNGEHTKVQIRRATFQGHLEVFDATAFREALTNGIGKAKGYGCGLITLARPTT
jgi:CRISPR system Cascade subunit CasE